MLPSAQVTGILPYGYGVGITLEFLVYRGRGTEVCVILTTDFGRYLYLVGFGRDKIESLALKPPNDACLVDGDLSFLYAIAKGDKSTSAFTGNQGLDMNGYYIS